MIIIIIIAAAAVTVNNKYYLPAEEVDGKVPRGDEPDHSQRVPVGQVNGLLVGAVGWVVRTRLLRSS